MLSNLFRKTAPYAAFDLDPKKIDQKKKDTRHAFLSTNDIITSWVFRYSECEYGMMAMNLRNRLKSITDTHAGNYSYTLLYSNEYDPDTIRSGMNNLKSPAILSFWTVIAGNQCVISNWTAFHHELVLPGKTKWEFDQELAATELASRLACKRCVIFHR
ncbi:hypothetical protein EDD86DRAFT_246607 [Gorgonomyces haynaldii]|nr:hypothetical protein EDD86DRAFT_246607 [Gorgonomyces haynaldii]